MFAKINHVAIISQNYSQLGRFYQSIFGMKAPSRARPHLAATVGDGYVGLNINPRFAGRPGRLDHFGMLVEDAETVFAKMKKKYPKVQWLARPTTRSFAAITTHDPDGNVFDLAQVDESNRKEVYADGAWQQDRRVHHIALRTWNADAMVEFYSDLFEFSILDKAPGDPNHYLSDGRVILVLMPWHITDYDGTGIVSPGMDHIGFKVESIEKVKSDIEDLCARNPYLRPSPVGTGDEGAARLKLFCESCPLGHYHLADSDGVLLDVTE